MKLVGLNLLEVISIDEMGVFSSLEGLMLRHLFFLLGESFSNLRSLCLRFCLICGKMEGG